MKLSIVSTLFHSESYINEFYRRVKNAAKKIAGEDYEIILVNDGSPDNSLNIAISLSESDNHIVVIDLSRNFGHHKAIMTGLAHAKGEYVFLIDSDLEEEPEWLFSFYEQLTRKCCDVVYGIQKKRKGSLFERWSGQLFYTLFNAMSWINLPRNVVTARLMTRRYTEALVLHDERELCLSGLWVITGFHQESHIIEKKSSSQTTYTISRKISHLVDAVTSFSSTPLIGIFYIGIIISFLAGLFIVYLLVNWLFFTKPLDGWTSVIASIWLIGGLIISFVGIVGIYLSKIFVETKRRPYTIVREIFRKKK